jgi:hypothetical protein
MVFYIPQHNIAVPAQIDEALCGKSPYPDGKVSLPIPDYL